MKSEANIEYGHNNKKCYKIGSKHDPKSVSNPSLSIHV